MLLDRADLNRSILCGSNLMWVRLAKANLDGADLSGALMHRAYLRKTTLAGANLKGTILKKATLSKANFTAARLDGADLEKAYLRGANLSTAILEGANLRYAVLAETNLTDTVLTGSRIYGVSVWNLRGEPSSQSGLRITLDHEPAITVDNLEIAQFIYLLLNHRKLRDALNSVVQRGVMLLGRFGGGGLEVLQAVAAKLREASYLPIIFDFDRPRARSYTETVKTLVGLSRFVIADLSGPSVPHELASTVPFYKLPFVPIMEKGRNPYSMFVDLLENDHVIKPIVEYEGTDQLLELMASRIIAPAEERHAKRQILLDQMQQVIDPSS
jgi:hypothetical protein